MTGLTEKNMRKIIERTLKLGSSFTQQDVDSKVKDSARWYVWDWNMGVAFYGICKACDALKDNNYKAQIREWIDARIDNGIKVLCVNTCAPMTTVMQMYKLYGQDKYEKLCRDFDDYLINKLPKTPSGAFSHTVMKGNNEGQIWADTLFMSVIYLATRGIQTGHRSFTEEALKQLSIHLVNLLDIDTGLFYHGWDDVAKKTLGIKWGRGNAWVTVSVIEILDMLDFNYPREGLLEILNCQLAALEKYQCSNGFWRTVIDESGTYEETSVTAGVSYGVLKGIRLGIISNKYMEMAQNGLEAVLSKIDEEGNVLGGSSGTPVKEDALAYNNIPCAVTPFTQGLTIMLLCEAALSE